MEPVYRYVHWFLVRVVKGKGSERVCVCMCVCVGVCVGVCVCSRGGELRISTFSKWFAASFAEATLFRMVRGFKFKS